jgi:hypothetical protein
VQQLCAVLSRKNHAMKMSKNRKVFCDTNNKDNSSNETKIKALRGILEVIGLQQVIAGRDG